MGARPTAMELLEDPFFAKPKLPPPEQGRRPSGLPQMEPEGDAHHRGANHQQQEGRASSEGEEACEVGIPPLTFVSHLGRGLHAMMPPQTSCPFMSVRCWDAVKVMGHGSYALLTLNF